MSPDAMAGLDGSEEGIRKFVAQMHPVTITVKDVSGVDGDAAIAVVRGTRRYIFEYSASLKFRASVPNVAEPSAPGTAYNGALSVADFQFHTTEEDIMRSAKVAMSIPVAAAHAAVVERGVEDLKRAVAKAFNEFKAAIQAQ